MATPEDIANAFATAFANVTIRQAPAAGYAGLMKPPTYTGVKKDGSWLSYKSTMMAVLSLKIKPGDDGVHSPENINTMKIIIYSSIRGEPAELISTLGPPTPPFIAATTVADYWRALDLVFMPAAEMNLARLRFRNRMQGQTESVQFYSSAKRTLFSMAYPDATNHVELLAGFLEGLYDPEVARATARGAHTTLQESTNAALAGVAQERRLVHQGKRKDTGGLSQVLFEVDTSVFEHQQHGRVGTSSTRESPSTLAQEEPMDMSQLGAMAYPGAQGHPLSGPEQGYDGGYEGQGGFEEVGNVQEDQQAVDLIYEYPDIALQMISDGLSAFEGLCYFCNKPGHIARNCFLKSKTRGRGGRGRFRGGFRGGFRGQGRGGYRGRGAGRGAEGAPRDAGGRYLPHQAIGHIEGRETEDLTDDQLSRALGETQLAPTDGSSF